MRKFVTGVKAFFGGRQEGVSLVEYALLMMLIALACIAAIVATSGGISNLFSSLGNKLGSGA